MDLLPQQALRKVAKGAKVAQKKSLVALLVAGSQQG